ncbi:MAG: signal peptidase I [Planctomycetota bacterium]
MSRSRGDREQPPPQKPTAGQQAAAFRFLLVGAGLALVLVYFLGQILDYESRSTVLWTYGRFAGVALFAWVGHSIGLGKGRVVAENLECLAIAVVMALILKYFLVEAYKIPTGSMQPTILGDENSAIFDRVLVNKFAYLVDDPERYDVIVFKFPLDRSKNYIKRLIGLPGEQITIFGGNIYASRRGEDGTFGPMKIARKERQIREAVMKTVYPSGRPNETFDAAFQVVTGSHSVDGDEVTLSAGTQIRFGHGEPIRDRYLDGYDPDWQIRAPDHVAEFGREVVSDLGVRFEFSPGAGCKEARLSILANEIEHRAVVGIGRDTGSRLESGYVGSAGDDLVAVCSLGTVVANDPDLSIEPGETVEIAFFHVDQELVLEIDGRQRLSFPYEISESSGSEAAPGVFPMPRRSDRNSVVVEIRGGPATLDGLKILRDIHYTNHGHSGKNVFEIPDDSLFALGDNTQNSHDGRMWTAERVTFKDGRKVLREHRDYGWDTLEFIDIYGETYRAPYGQEPIIDRKGIDPFNFIPRNLLLGKAIAVFWPIFPHFRWKLLR